MEGFSKICKNIWEYYDSREKTPLLNFQNYAPKDGKVRIYGMGGAGYVFTYNGFKIGIDLYLSDHLHEPDGAFKRLTVAPCKPEDLELDYLICSHEHGDHFDLPIIPVLLEKNPDMKLLCPSTVIEFAKELDMDTERYIPLDIGGTFEENGIHMLGVYADHGPDWPGVIGVILTMGGKTIFFAGDGRYHDNYPDLIMGHKGFDVQIQAINGRYGQPNSQEGADIAEMCEAKVTIPCHYWLFAEHSGDPITFIEACQAKNPPIKGFILGVGEEYIVE